MPSSWMASSAMVMFSREWGWLWGRLLCFSFRFWRTSTRATSLKEQKTSDIMKDILRIAEFVTAAHINKCRVVTVTYRFTLCSKVCEHFCEEYFRWFRISHTFYNFVLILLKFYFIRPTIKYHYSGLVPSPPTAFVIWNWLYFEIISFSSLFTLSGSFHPLNKPINSNHLIIWMTSLSRPIWRLEI